MPSRSVSCSPRSSCVSRPLSLHYPERQVDLLKPFASLSQCNYTKDRADSGSYRIPIGLQFAWAIILATGLFLLPDSPRYYVKRGQLDKARDTLVRLRGQAPTSQYIEVELAEIVANAEIEAAAIPTNSWFASWKACFTGSIWSAQSNLRRTILGTSLQMMQQWTGVNFMCVSLLELAQPSRRCC